MQDVPQPIIIIRGAIKSLFSYSTIPPRDIVCLDIESLPHTISHNLLFKDF